VKLFIYILIVAVVAMMYKTFYYDYQKREIPTEVNASIEASEVSEPEPVTTVEPVKNNTSDEENRTGWQSRKGMPIERLGDSIGESLKDKIKVK
jgi:hypothetical protein